MKNNSKILNKVYENESDFIKCGITGWCLEVVWTGMINFLNNDKKLSCNTSLIMFPIYGMAFLIKPISKLIKNLNFFFRGCIYTGLIFVVEYVSGLNLKKHNICPWDYSKAKYNIKGIIRLDYAPAWFTVGLLYEKLLLLGWHLRRND